MQKAITHKKTIITTSLIMGATTPFLLMTSAHADDHDPPEPEPNQELLPTSTVGDITDGFFGVVTSNIVPILAVTGTMLGVYFILRRLNKVRSGKV